MSLASVFLLLLKNLIIIIIVLLTEKKIFIEINYLPTRNQIDQFNICL